MPRPLRVHIANGVFHVTQRATGHETLFIDATDHDTFDRLLGLAVKRARWKLHAHCHMSNHVHLLVQTPAPTLPLGMQFLTSQYVQEFNLRHGRRGALVQGRYKSGLVETPEHFLSCLQYFALNPVAAGLCDRPEDWPWSSYTGLERILKREFDMAFA